MKNLSSIIIQKYGGTSLQDLKHVQKIAKHIQQSICQQNKKGVIVVSAMGNHTDRLWEQAHTLSSNPPAREMDMLLSTGERVAAALLSIALNELGLNFVSLTGSQCGILTTDDHGKADIQKIDGQRILTSLDTADGVIVAGFQGVSPRTKEVTTLGRGGSDLTAIALSAYLGVNQCQIYTDVSGIYTANPNDYPKAQLQPKLSFVEARLLAEFGAQVIHSKAAKFAESYSIPFEVRSSYNPNKKGTHVQGNEPSAQSILGMQIQRNSLDDKQLQLNIIGQNINSKLELKKTIQNAMQPFASETLEFEENCLKYRLAPSHVQECLAQLHSLR